MVYPLATCTLSQWGMKWRLSVVLTSHEPRKSPDPRPPWWGVGLQQSFLSMDPYMASGRTGGHHCNFIAWVYTSWLVSLKNRLLPTEGFSLCIVMFAFSTVVVIDISKLCPVQKLVEWRYAWRMEHMSYFPVVRTTIRNRYATIECPIIIMCFKM